MNEKYELETNNNAHAQAHTCEYNVIKLHRLEAVTSKMYNDRPTHWASVVYGKKNGSSLC